jgi:UDP-2,3-diacylglucosamine pyrophosphatase LpxH
MRPLTGESLLVFSDVHLGSDLNDGGPSVPRSAAIDTDLAALLAHYRDRPPPQGPWRLVIAGDFIDFVGMSIDLREDEVVETDLTAAEVAFGLGGAEDHVRLKLRRVAARHKVVFEELASFVAAGHRITLVHGNHDLELHWDGVKADFCALLADLAAVAPAEVTARVEFLPWFFYREGLVFIEHGHQYDPFCATPYILAPLSPRDPRRVLPSLSDQLLRYIVRRTPGMKEYGHETRGLTSYISWGLMLGARGTLGLFVRFFQVIFELRKSARAYEAPAAAVIRSEHDRRLTGLAAAIEIPESRLHAALALHSAPLGRTPRGVLASVMLDRLGTAVLMSIGLAVILACWGRLGAAALPVTLGLVAIWVLSHVVFSRGRPNVDPAAVMVDRVPELGRLFPSSFVVMGHTHIPETRTVGEVVYVNLGSWAEEEPDPKEDAAKAYRAARTHLVIHAKADRHEARLLEWRSGEGPREIEAVVRPQKTPSVLAPEPVLEQVAVG